MKTNMQMTSLLSYIEREEEDLNETQEEKVYQALKQHGNRTALELLPLTGLPINCITGRINSLVKHNRVKEGIKRHNITGRLAIEWEAI